MGLTTSALINEVLPEGSVLYKHNHGLFSFYLTDDNFRSGESFLDQNSSLDFHVFIEEIISTLIELEADHIEPLVQADYDLATLKHF